MMYDKIKKELLKYFSRVFSLDISIDQEDKNLLLHPFSFSPILLLYIYFDLQKKFSISIDKNMIIRGNFCTINNITETILKSIKIGEEINEAE